MRRSATHSSPNEQQLEIFPRESAKAPLLAFAAAMAVPKQKQARARTRKRRAQHKISAPRYNECPQCHSPRLPHRVCPECGFYS